jgi:hypothetical protein
MRKVLEPTDSETFSPQAAQALRKHADELMQSDSKLTFGRALERIAGSRDPSDKAIWTAAKDAA